MFTVFVCAKLTHCSVQISIMRIIVYLVVGLSGECRSCRKDNVHCRVREGRLRSPKKSGIPLDRRREVCGTFR